MIYQLSGIQITSLHLVLLSQRETCLADRTRATVFVSVTCHWSVKVSFQFQYGTGPASKPQVQVARCEQ